MTAERSDRQPVKIRRRGRHASPSQVEKVAQQAGKAAPAVAIAGALVAVPSAQQALAATASPTAATAAGHQAATGTAAGTGASTMAPGTATLDAVETRAVTVASTSAARHAAKTTSYRVRSGDSLSGIAERFYHNPSDWSYLYHENAKTISNPNLIYVGQHLLVPATVPADYKPASYTAKHAKTTPRVVTTSKIKTSSTGTRGGSAEGGTKIGKSAPLGQYSCSALESEWEQAGGSPAHALMAAEIARAESGGNPNAISPTDDFGLWQINGSHGSLATLNPYQNARSAVILSDNGTNWNPWTTYRTGAYYGQC
jgi:LysM repeat protein